MSLDILPPNPCLVAILLAVRVDFEPRIVFHYPPRPGQDNTHITRYLAAQEKDGDGSSSTDDESSSSQDEAVIDTDKTKDTKIGDYTPELDVEDPASASPEKPDIWDTQYGKVKWSDLFGLPLEGLAKLLCPPVSSHKQRFEMSIDDKVFIGRPVFAKEGAQWQKKKTERRAKAKKPPADDGTEKSQAKGTSSEPTSAPENEESTSEFKHGERSKGDGHVQEGATNGGQPFMFGGQPSIKVEQSKAAKKEILNMFHVVFVLNPPPLEYQLRVQEMYEHVIKKFTKALRWEQARSSYVSRQASLLYKEAPLMKRALGKL